MYTEKALELCHFDDLTEASVEDDSTTVFKVEKWYKALMDEAKSKSSTKEDIQHKIKELKECVKKMKDQRKNPDKNFGREKYMLKAFIPFNNIYRVFKYGDGMAGTELLTNVLLSRTKFQALGALVVRGVGYQKMLDDMIKSTEDAIDFLEKKLKKMK